MTPKVLPRIWLKLILALLVLTVVLLFSLYSAPTTFSINAVTQIHRIVLGQTHNADWNFPNATLIRGDSFERQAFSGTIAARPGTEVSFERIGDGPLRIRFVAGSKGGISATTQTEDQQTQSISGDFYLLAKPAFSVDEVAYDTVLPMRGKIIVGMIVGNQLEDPATLLLRGKVTMLSHTFVGARRYEVGSAELELGDSIDVSERGEAQGLLVFGQRADMTTIFRVVATQIAVARYGSQGYVVSASPITRIANDPLLQGIWVATLFILGFIAKWQPKLVPEKAHENEKPRSYTGFPRAGLRGFRRRSYKRP